MERLFTFVKNSTKNNVFVQSLSRRVWQSHIVDVVRRRLFLHKVVPSAKQRATTTVRLWAQQCECVIAHRVRRAHQLLHLYSQIWEGRVLRAMTIAHLARRGGHHLLLASCLAAVFDWDTERISDEVLARHLNDIEYVHRLQELTLRCAKCGLQRVVTGSQVSKYCQCPAGTGKPAPHLTEWEESLSAACSEPQDEGWEPFIERPDVQVWRQQHEVHTGLYAYKVYGRYDDVTARDFLRVQLDTEYRREWDPSAVDLRVLDVESQTASEVIYWEMAWPRLFSNRDYVFKRRSLIDSERNQIVIRSESTQHPACPPRSGLHRVDEYWSCMVIRPLQSELDKPGIEFCLTYFDNPGLSIPSAVAAWVAMSGLPNFLNSLRQAARALQEQRDRPPVIPQLPQVPPQSPPQTVQVPAPSAAESSKSNSSQQSTHPGTHLVKPSPLQH